MALHIALVEPQIPPNTGNIARLCAATGTPLHLVEPLGFSLDAPEVKRAGLDYWDAVDLWMHRDWHAFRDVVSRDRCLYFSAHAERSFWTAPYPDRAVLVFGNESDGLPDRIREKHADRLYRIPMLDAGRSLNLATAVGVVRYEGLRQQARDEPRRPGAYQRRHREAGVPGDQASLSERDRRRRVEPARRDVLGDEASDRLLARARVRNGGGARYGALPGLPGRGTGRVGRRRPGDGAGRSRRHDGAPDLLHDGLGRSRHAAARPVHARQDRRAHAQRGRRDRGVSQDRVGVLRAVRGGRADGARHRARQEARAAVRGVARGRIWPLGDLLRRPVQAGAEGTGADPRGETLGGGTGGAEEISPS